MRAAAAIICLAALCLAAPGAARKPPSRSFADPSSIFAAEIALNRLAREKGQWTALRETAADDAVMFAPLEVRAKDWLKGRANPPEPVQREARNVYISCDRRTAAATGIWHGPEGAQGHFTRIWRLDEKGRWKWVLDYRERGDVVHQPDDFVEGHAAQCRADHRPGAEGVADDSLRWSYEAHKDGGGALRVSLWTGEGYETVIDERIAAAVQ